MRSKRSFNRSFNAGKKETLIQSNDQILAEFLKCSPDSHSKETVPTNARIECMINLLNCVRTIYSSSTSIEERSKFEKDLLDNCKTISYNLISFLIQNHSNVIRLLSLRLILYLTHLSKFNQQLQQFNINIYIVRIIDLDFSIDETALAIEYIRLLLQLYPDSLDESYLYCLISSLEDSKFKLNSLILETILEITYKNPRLACKCQLFTDLINYTVNVGNENEFCIEITMQCLLKVLDRQEYRDCIRFDDLFRNLIAPFVDYEYVPMLWGSEFSSHKKSDNTNSNETFEPKITEILSSCSVALLTLLNSYIGLMCFSANESRLLRDLISPLSWFLKSNKRDFLEKELNQLSASSSLHSLNMNIASNKKLNQIQQIISSQLTVLNYLMDFFYKLFDIDEINTKTLIKRRKQTSQMQNDLLNDEEFVNSECESLLELVDEFQSNASEPNTIVSLGPDLPITFKALLLKTFIEVGFFESLLDLYFGLPISFLENNYNYSRLNMNSSYQNLSLRCLNLFVNLYSSANYFFSNEYCIDNFNEMFKHDSSQLFSKGIYTELKKLSLVSYLKNLNDSEREKEVIFYLTEFNTKQESMRAGSSPPIEELSKMSFFTQQFLAHSGFLNSSKFEIELEILNLANTRQFIQNSISGRHPNSLLDDIVASLVDEGRDGRRGAKKNLNEIEKKLENQIDLTLVLQFDSNISNYDLKLSQQADGQAKHWNWFEVIKLFEIFLLTSSSMQPRFSPTQDALMLDANKRLQNEKLLKCLTKLFAFFSLNKEILSSLNRTNASHRSSISLSNVAGFNLSDLISCSGCYLIDFALSRFNLNNLNQANLSRSDACRYFTPYEYGLIQLLQNIKLYLTIEFFPTASASTLKRSASNTSLQGRFITKDSLIAYYILFIGHLSGSERGDSLVDSFKLYELIIKIIDATRDINIMKLIVSTFNYYVSVKSRSILEKCMSLSCAKSDCSYQDETSCAYSEFKIYVFKLIFNIYRANCVKFEAFFIDVILHTIVSSEMFNPDEELKAITSTNLNDQFVIELGLNLIEYFLNHRPDLTSPLIQLNSFDHKNKTYMLKKLLVDSDQLKMCIKKHSLLKVKTRLLMNRFWLNKLSVESFSLDYLKEVANEWHAKKMDLKYFQLIERNFFQVNSINSCFVEEYEDRLAYGDKSSSTGRFVQLYRRINEPNKNNDLYSALKAQSIPIHYNSILIRSKQFIENGYFLDDKLEDKLVNFIRKIKSESSQAGSVNDQTLKSALWSICSLCNCENGFNYLKILNNKYKLFVNLFEFSSSIIKITESHGNLSVRATGFLCLNFFSKTNTGANLIGKIGWITFQPNKVSGKQAFFSSLSSFSNEEKNNNSGYSPLHTAVVLYNLYRIQMKLNLKLIYRESFEISDYEKEFLQQQTKIDLMSINDDYVLKSEDKFEFLSENVTVPMRQSLIAAESNICLDLERLELSNKTPSESKLTKEPSQRVTENDKVKSEILNAINKLTPVVNLDNIRASLSELKKNHSEKFDLSLHNLIAKKVLSKQKYKFHFRKFIQELFYDLSINL